MLFGKVREAWKNRARRHLVYKAGKADWCIFAKALCGSWNICSGYPFDCKCCFDYYFNGKKIRQQI